MKKKELMREAIAEERAALPRVDIDDLVGLLKYYVDLEEPHLWINDPEACGRCPYQPCLHFCPTGVYRLDPEGNIIVGYEGCVECGACRVGCPSGNIGWKLPRGGYGVAYKFG